MSDEILLIIATGLVTGSCYGLVGLAMVLIRRGSGVINLAQGDIGMLAAFVYWMLVAERGVPVGVAALAAVAAGGVLGAVMHLLVMRHMAGARAETTMLMTVAIGSLLQLGATDLWGADALVVASLVSGPALNIGPVLLSRPQVLAIVVAVLAAVVLAVLYRFTTWGLRVRAVAANSTAATLVGVDARRVSTSVWAAGGALSGLAAVLVAPLVSFRVIFMFLLLGRVLAALVSARLESFVGVFGAAIAVAMAETWLTLNVASPGAVELALVVLVIALLVLAPPRSLVVR